MEQSVLLVDDDPYAVLSVSKGLKAAGLEARVHGATDIDKGLSILRETQPQVAVIDLSLEKASGVESGFALLNEILAFDPTCRVIVVTGHGATEYGIRALNSGAASFLQKPTDISHLAALIRDGINQSELRRSFLKLTKVSQDPVLSSLVIGSSAKSELLRDEIRYASQTNQNVLICGETGTGKGLCAFAIHKLSNRRNANLVRYSPNFSTADLVNSDLFGHIKGAFTGADQDRKGLVPEAQRGTLFLDEVDELPTETQVSLLGVLQDKKFRPLGSNREETADFRLVTASNRNIQECLEQGKLRKDFFHRISHLRITIPPLRERLEDLADLSKHILERLNQTEQLGTVALTSEASSKLLGYEFPGNIRELEAVVEGGAYRARYNGRTLILPEDIQLNGTPRQNDNQTFHDKIQSYKQKLVVEALSRNEGNQLKSARELGIDRGTLKKLLEVTN